MKPEKTPSAAQGAMLQGEREHASQEEASSAWRALGQLWEGLKYCECCNCKIVHFVIHTCVCCDE